MSDNMHVSTGTYEHNAQLSCYVIKTCYINKYTLLRMGFSIIFLLSVLSF